MEEKPSYYSILTADVRYDERLTPNEKLMYSEITALMQKSGVCWANNAYFAELYKVSKETVSRWINHLFELNYICVQITRDVNTKQILERSITIPTIDYQMSIGIDKNVNRGIDKNVNRGIDKNVKENNINNINNTSINNIKEEETIDDLILKEPFELRDNLKEFLKMRKAIKKPMTTRAFNLLTKRLIGLSNNSQEQNAILEQSILNSWQDIYPLKKENQELLKKSQELNPDEYEDVSIGYIDKYGITVYASYPRKKGQTEWTEEERAKILKEVEGVKFLW